MRFIHNLKRANRVRKQEGYYSLLFKTSRFVKNRMKRKADQQSKSNPLYWKADQQSRPHYYFAARLAGKQAERLGYDKVSLIEFGVAGGRGLVALEELVEDLEEEFDISYEIYGFDLGSGIPSPESYKDSPYFWDRGHYEMDVELLQSKLNRAELVLGDVENTVPEFIPKYNPAPVGGIYVDLDYYSSTKNALKILDVDGEYISPRVPMYFDDVMGGSSLRMTVPQIGEEKTIEEYNESANQDCIGKLKLEDNEIIRGGRQYAYHRFNHDLYNKYIGPEDRQNPLDIE